jgi:Leucine-rich repeat (LRR) protein
MFGGTEQIHKSGTKAWAEAIKNHLSLTDLNISSNYIDAKDAEILGPAIRDNTVLLTLILKGNKLLTAEAGNALSDMVAANTALETLDVSNNGWEVDGKVDGRADGVGFAKSFSVGLRENQSLTSLHIGLNPIPEEEMMKVIDIAMRKDSMKLICNVPIKDKTLTKLDLSGGKLGVQGARVVENYYLLGAQVATLNMSRNMLLTKEGGKVIKTLLKGNEMLKDLDVSDIHMEDTRNQDVPGFAKEIAEGLSINNGVMRLNLSKNRMATKDVGQALENVLKANTTLKELDVSSNQFVGDGADSPGFAQGVFRGISQNKTLTSLDVSNNNLGDLVLPGGWVYSGIFGLNEYTHTDGRHAKFNPGKPEGVFAVIEALAASKSSSLSSVNLLENNISINDAHTLANILKDEHTTIKSLCGNKGDEKKLYMGGKVEDVGGAIMLAAEIANNEVLEELSFGNNGDVVTVNKDMSEANLSGIGEVRAIMLSAFLPKCT